MRAYFAHLHRTCASLRACGFVVLVGILFGWMPVFATAHEGHDLVPASAESTAARGLPRLVLSSENYELVAILSGVRLTIYLDRFRDNAPVTDANITVMINEESVAAQTAGDGTYVITSPRFGSGGLLEFVFDITAAEADDLLIGKMVPVNVGPADNAPHFATWYVQAASSLRHGAEDHLVLMALTLLSGLVLGIGVHRGRARIVSILLLTMFALGTAALDRTAYAHDVNSPEDGRAPFAAPGDVARRLPDGKVFVPKPTQRILDVRTVIAKSETLPKAVTFVGRVIANPNRSGVVQSINGGRVIAAEQGLPQLGQAITKGDVLAAIEPPIAAADRTTISERMGELEQMIAVAEAKLRRLHSMAERQVVPQALVIETEAELEGLYRRRDVVREIRAAPEILHAPIDGVIAMSRVVAGQVVQAQDLLFQIVDPTSLWVEAYDYGGSDPATLNRATAVAVGNIALKLSFQGASRTLQQQATLLQFAIADPPSSLRVGQPLTVTAQRDDSINGIVLDRGAVVRASNGETVVWCHMEPEYFEARPVRTEPFDARRILIAAGIGEGERVVVSGAELINQIH